MQPIKLNPTQEYARRLSLLLTELETATAQALTTHFSFTPPMIERMLAATRSAFVNSRHVEGLVGNRQHLADASLRFGLAAVEALQKNFGFDGAQGDAFLQLLITTAKANREGGGVAT